MSNLFGQPHYELIQRYGYHENVLARCLDKAEAEELLEAYVREYEGCEIKLQYRGF